MATRSGSPGAALRRCEKAMRKLAMSYPDTREDHPWGHSAFKVRGKTFCFLSAGSEGLSLSVKLPVSGYDALLLPFAEPTGYGLGKSGWISASFEKGSEAPTELLELWLEESYRAIAPKKLSALLDGALPPAKAASKRKAVAKKKAPARKKAAAKKTVSRSKRTSKER